MSEKKDPPSAVPAVAESLKVTRSGRRQEKVSTYQVEIFPETPEDDDGIPF